MRYAILIFTLLFSTLSIQAQNTKVSYINKRFASSSIQSLDASTSGGSVRVEGGSGEASVEILLSPNGSTLRKGSTDLKAIFEKEYDLELGMKGNVLVAKAKRKSSLRGNHPLSVSYVIHLPVKVDSRVATSGGSITMKNLTGNQSFATSGGSLTLTQLKGEIQGRTSGGSITAEGNDGDIQLSTSGGSITLSNLSGTITAKTSGGSITGKQVTGKLHASTSGGSVRLDGIEGDVHASTSGGSITANILKVTNPLKLSTSAGSVNLKLPKGSYDLDLGGSKVNIDHLENFSGSAKRDRVKGSLNGGGHLVSASTSAGSVNVSWQ